MSILENPLVDSPEREFADFCRARLDGLALSSGQDTLDLYAQAREKGAQILAGMEDPA